MSYLKNKLEIEITYQFCVVNSFVWVMLYYYLTKYYQRLVYVERLYPYIHSLEKDLNIERESGAYLNDYPKVSDFIHISFNFVFPLVFIIAAIIKITVEWINRINWVCLMLDTIIFITIIITIVLSVIYMKNKS